MTYFAAHRYYLEIRIDFFISSGDFRQCLRYDDITIFCFKFMISVHTLVVQQDLETYQRPRFTQTLVLWLSQGLKN